MLTREMLVELMSDIISSEIFQNTDDYDNLSDYIRCVAIVSLPKGIPAGMTMASMEWLVQQCIEIKKLSYND
jgi:hypothetical protein